MSGPESTEPEDRSREHVLGLLKEFLEIEHDLERLLAEHEQYDPVVARLRDALAAKGRLKDWLAHTETPPSLPKAAATALRNVRADKGFLCDRLESALGMRRPWWAGINDKDYPGSFLVELWAEFMGLYDDDDDENAAPVARRAARCGTIVVSERLPPNLIRLLGTVKRCFAIGLFDASIVFCRSLLEVAAFEFLADRGDLPNGRNVASVLERSDLSALLDRIGPYVPAATIGGGHRVRKMANDVLHSKQQGRTPSEQDAFESIMATFGFIERLYSGE
jgi:hypothetical protein